MTSHFSQLCYFLCLLALFSHAIFSFLFSEGLAVHYGSVETDPRVHDFLMTKCRLHSMIGQNYFALNAKHNQTNRLWWKWNDEWWKFPTKERWGLIHIF